MNEAQVLDILDQVDYVGADGERWGFKIGVDYVVQGVGMPGTDRKSLWLQPVFVDSISEEPQSGRKWRLSEHMTKSEVVLTAWKAVLTAEEHEARERFRYRGARIFGPHIDVDVLADIAAWKHNLDLRAE